MAELIGQSERRSQLTDRQTDGRRSRLIGGCVFLPTGKAKESYKEKNRNRKFHFGSRFGFVACRCAPAQRRQAQEI